LPNRSNRFEASPIKAITNFGSGLKLTHAINDIFSYTKQHLRFTMMPSLPQHETRSVIRRPPRPVTPTFELPSSDDDWEHSHQESSKVLLRTKSIPIASKISRTSSEVQVEEEEAMADYRDYAMFSRIVDGIHRTQQQTRDYRWRQANDLSLKHVVNARNSEDASRWGLADKTTNGQPLTTTSLVSLLTQGYSQEEEPMLFALEL
jgi:hypothetical protein